MGLMITLDRVAFGEPGKMVVAVLVESAPKLAVRVRVPDPVAVKKVVNEPLPSVALCAVEKLSVTTVLMKFAA